jgi:glycosyltransferase involved in cell wall biosynthesis
VTLCGPGRNAGTARNVALDRITGDVVVYLDDDNRLHPMWLKAVAWAFTELPDTSVAYGARLVDDWTRVRNLEGLGLPALHFERFDRATLEERNQVDMGAIAHRPSAVRFDESLRLYGDWDLFLQLTAEHDPLELPVVALFYRSRIDGRLSEDGDDEAEQDYIRAREAERRGRKGEPHGL